MRNRKILSILLTLAMLATLLAPLATPAAASSTYSVNSVQSVVADTTYAGAFNRVIMEVAPGSLAVGQAAYIRMSLPIDFTTNAAVSAPVFSTGTNLINGAASTITPIGAAPAREYQITVVGANSTDRGLLYIDLADFRVPSGKSGDIKVSFDAAPGSPLSSGQVVVAQIGTGVVTISMDDVKTISTAGGPIAEILVKEDRPKALANSAKTVKIKLPNGFTWGTAGASAALVYGSDVRPTAYGTEDSGRTLYFNQPVAAGSTSPAYYRISGLTVSVDESVAKTGDIEATVSGDSTISTSTLIVGKLGDFSNTVSAFGDPKEVRAGRDDEEIGKIAIEETVAGSLTAGRTITLQLTGGAVWHTYPRIDSANSSNTGTLSWSLVSPLNDLSGVPYSNTIKATVTGSSSSPAKYVLEKGTILLEAIPKPEIKVVVGGTAGAAGEVVVAKVIRPITVKTAGKPANLIAGVADQPIPDIIIEETQKEAILASNFNPNYPYDSVTGIVLRFPAGVFPSLPNVEVIEGDLVINKDSITRAVTADGRWSMCFSVKSASSTPSKIKVSNIKLRLDRDVAEGPITLAMLGASFQTFRIWGGGIPSYAGALVGFVVTPASGEVKINASFVIDSDKYKAGGVEKTMDVAPYVKDGRTFLPVRYVAEALGIANDNILWNEADQTVTLLKGGKVVQIKIGDKSLLVNGVAVSMDAAAEITSGRTMLPMRFIAQALGASVAWDEATRTVTLK